MLPQVLQGYMIFCYWLILFALLIVWNFYKASILRSKALACVVLGIICDNLGGIHLSYGRCVDDNIDTL